MADAEPPASGGSDESGASVPDALLRHWVHSHEEDTPTEVVYRPSTTKLPPARGRRGIEFTKDGQVIQYGLGAGDAGSEERGRWRSGADGRVHLSFDREDAAPPPLTIVAVGPDQLRVRREL
jgi:hypothetical protein